MGKKIALILISSMFANVSAGEADYSSSSGVYDFEAQQTDDLGTEVDQKVAKLLKELADKVNSQSDQISALQDRVVALEEYISNNQQDNSVNDAPYS